MKHLRIVPLFLVVMLAGTLRGAEKKHSPVNPDVLAGITSLDIAPVWSGHPVGFALLTRGDHQFAAFYDKDRRMTVGQRTLGQRRWSFTVLPSSVGWDTHNLIAMALDRDGYLHVAGNMHTTPLVYFRSARPYDAATLERVASMTSAPEDHVTYPLFSYTQDGALLFQYRSGRSGQGNTLTDIYDERTRQWQPLTPQPLFSGEGQHSAYPLKPVLGPDGWYHQVWVWRDTPMAETNHDLSYAKSRDLIHWETAGGASVALPLTFETPGLIVDPVQPKGGLINGTQSVGFDSEGRVVIAYIKYDDHGITQLYFARWQDGAWQRYQASAWNYRWDFHGGGSIEMQVRCGPLRWENGRLTLDIQHKIYGDATWVVDPATMQLSTRLPNAIAAASGVPAVHAEDSGSPDMLIEKFADDSGGRRTDHVRYRLNWQTLPENRDQPRPGPPPPPSMLKLLILP
jgi:hypothetical protein